VLGGGRLCHLKELLCATARGAQWSLEVLPESPRCAWSIAGIFEASGKGELPPPSCTHASMVKSIQRPGVEGYVRHEQACRE
jgi:hypothetical protein